MKNLFQHRVPFIAIKQYHTDPKTLNINLRKSNFTHEEIKEYITQGDRVV